MQPLPTPSHVPEAQVVPIVDPGPAVERSEWANRISEKWQSTAAAIMRVGELLIEAKAQLKHGEFQAMLRSDLPFSPRRAQMLMKIAADTRLQERNIVSLLPPSWATLHAITQLNDEQFEAKVADGTIQPTMRRKDLIDRPEKLNRKRSAKASEGAGEQVDIGETATAGGSIQGDCSALAGAFSVLARTIEAGPETLAVIFASRLNHADPQVRSAVERDLELCYKFAEACRAAMPAECREDGSSLGNSFTPGHDEPMAGIVLVTGVKQ